MSRLAVGMLERFKRREGRLPARSATANGVVESN